MLDPFVICCVPTASSVEALKTELIFTLGAMESARPLLGVGKGFTTQMSCAQSSHTCGHSWPFCPLR